MKNTYYLWQIVVKTLMEVSFLLQLLNVHGLMENTQYSEEFLKDIKLLI